MFAELGISKMMVSVITSSPQLLLRKPNDFPQVCNDTYGFMYIFELDPFDKGKSTFGWL